MMTELLDGIIIFETDEYWPKWWPKWWKIG